MRAALLFGLCAALGGAAWLAVEPLRVVSDSMLPGLRPGERVWLDKLAFRRRDPERGEVVVVRRGEGDDERRYVKRLVGLPGERVDLVDEVLFIDGEPLTRRAHGDFAAAGRRFQLLEVQTGARRFRILDDPERATEAAHRVLGPGEYWVLGDHRDHSEDSRRWGPIRREALLGPLWGRP